MSFTETVRTRLSTAGLTAAGLIALLPNLAGAPQHSDSNRNTGPALPSETKIPAARKTVQREPIPYPTLRKPTSQLRSGTSRTGRHGVTGEKEVTYRVYSRTDGVELRREVVSTRILKKPIPEIVEEGRRTTLASRGYFSGRRIVTMVATTYDPYHCGGSGSGRTFSGLLGGYGVVAVDPRFIPLGTRLYIEGYGYAVAADTGGAIKGNRIDLGINSKHDAAHIHNMKAVRVHIID
jgi:3D (Asp-Asp-Asp) domain-containing protein